MSALAQGLYKVCGKVLGVYMLGGKDALCHEAEYRTADVGAQCRSPLVH